MRRHHGTSKFSNRSSCVSDTASHQAPAKRSNLQSAALWCSDKQCPMVSSKHGPPSLAHLGDCADEVCDEGSLSQHGERPDHQNGYTEFLSIVRKKICIQTMREDLTMVCIEGEVIVTDT